jgi:cell division protein FtsB
MIQVKKVSLFFIILFLATAFIFLNSYTRLQELKDRSRKLDTMIENLKTENALLQQQIQYLKNDPFFQEKVLREKTGLVRKGEVPFKIEAEE